MFCAAALISLLALPPQAEQGTVTVTLDLKEVPAILNVPGFKAKLGGVEESAAALLAKQLSLWKFVKTPAVGGVPAARLLVSFDPSNVPDGEIAVRLRLKLADGTQKAIREGPQVLYKAGHFLPDFGDGPEAMARGIDRRLQDLLLDCEDPFLEKALKATVPVATGVDNPAVPDRGRLPLPWEECKKFSTSTFRVEARLNGNAVEVHSYGTGSPANGGLELCLDSYDSSTGKVAIAATQGLLQQLVLGVVWLKESRRTAGTDLKVVPK